jgi:hypothetical protein
LDNRFNYIYLLLLYLTNFDVISDRKTDRHFLLSFHRLQTLNKVYKIVIRYINLKLKAKEYKIFYGCTHFLEKIYATDCVNFSKMRTGGDTHKNHVAKVIPEFLISKIKKHVSLRF